MSMSSLGSRLQSLEGGGSVGTLKELMSEYDTDKGNYDSAALYAEVKEWRVVQCMYSCQKCDLYCAVKAVVGVVNIVEGTDVVRIVEVVAARNYPYCGVRDCYVVGIVAQPEAII
jgi:hypothetical protein